VPSGTEEEYDASKAISKLVIDYEYKVVGRLT
jgi:hypothetical protein